MRKCNAETGFVRLVPDRLNGVQMDEGRLAKESQQHTICCQPVRPETSFSEGPWIWDVLQKKIVDSRSTDSGILKDVTY